MDDVPEVSEKDLGSLYIPPKESHKGQNGKLLIIGGSHLFHAASVWALQVASRIVDLVHYSSVPDNNELVFKAKEEFRNGIVVPREDVESYVKEDDCILIGPGMVRTGGTEVQSATLKVQSLQEALKIADEGQQTEAITNYLLRTYPEKRWVIDAGALQMVDVRLIPKNSILTPHRGEFVTLSEKFKAHSASYCEKAASESNPEDLVRFMAQDLNCTILLKGPVDTACSPTECRRIAGGNAGMTKGGTGDVLAGLIAALACKNEPFLAAIAGSFINKKAGDVLNESVGPFFNATDLANQIPRTMATLLR